MIKIKQAIIVEGRYDKIRLSNIVDAVIICTNGFSIYKDKEKQELIKSLAARTGIIILTDSDSAGFQIRSFIRSIVKQGEVLNAVTPDIPGKERRKQQPSKQGKLGVEGIPDELLIQALKNAVGNALAIPVANASAIDVANASAFAGENASAIAEANTSALAEAPEENPAPITRADLLELGLIGGEGSAQRRRELQRRLGLPELLSAKLLLEVANKMFTRSEFITQAEKI